MNKTFPFLTVFLPVPLLQSFFGPRSTMAVTFFLEVCWAAGLFEGRTPHISIPVVCSCSSVLLAPPPLPTHLPAKAKGAHTPIIIWHSPLQLAVKRCTKYG